MSFLMEKFILIFCQNTNEQIWIALWAMWELIYPVAKTGLLTSKFQLRREYKSTKVKTEHRQTKKITALYPSIYSGFMLQTYIGEDRRWNTFKYNFHQELYLLLSLSHNKGLTQGQWSFRLSRCLRQDALKWNKALTRSQSHLLFLFFFFEQFV